MTNGKENQLKGLKGEEFYVDCFKNIGYETCKRAEKGSLYDAIGIDLINIPYLIQIKTGIQKNMNPGKILTLLYAQLNNNIDKNHTILKENFNLFVIHHREVNDLSNDIIYMSLDTYHYYLTKYTNIEIEYSNIRDSKLQSEFNKIIGINMNEFYNKVLKKEI